MVSGAIVVIVICGSEVCIMLLVMQLTFVQSLRLPSKPGEYRSVSQTEQLKQS